MKNPASSNQNTEYIHRKTDEDGIANCFTNGDQKTSKRIINISFAFFKWLEATVTGKQLRGSFGIRSLRRSLSHVRLRGDSRVDLKPTEEVIYISFQSVTNHLQDPSGGTGKSCQGDGLVLSFHFNLYNFFLFHVM